MSRSGYSDDILCDKWAIICWRGAVASAIRGQRGQAFLQELIAALEAMPNKRLITNELERDGDYCALGVVGHARGLPMDTIDPVELEDVAKAFGMSEALAREIMDENDETLGMTPEQRWSCMRAWALKHLSL